MAHSSSKHPVRLALGVASIMLMQCSCQGIAPDWPAVNEPWRTPEFEAVNTVYLFSLLNGNGCERSSVLESLPSKKAAEISMQDLQFALGRLGVSAKVYTCRPQKLQELQMPVIVYTESEEGTGGGYLILLKYDLARGICTLIKPDNVTFVEMTIDQFLRSWSGYLLTHNPISDNSSRTWRIVALASSTWCLFRLWIRAKSKKDFTNK